MKHTKLIIGLAIAVVLVAAGIAYSILQPGPPVAAVEVRPGTIRASVADRARTSVPGIARLTMPVDGRILPITIEPGTAVKQGEVLARLDTTELEAQAAAVRAEVAAIEAQLNLLADNALENTLLAEAKQWIAAMAKVEESAAALIEANAANAAFTDWWKEAEEKLKQQGAVAEETYRRAKADSSQAEVDLAVARLNRQIVAVFQKISDLGPEYVRRYLARKTLEARVFEQQQTAAEARLNIAEYQLERAAIRAPQDGVVLSRLVESERVLPAGTELLTLGDPERLQVTLDLLSDDAGQVRVGDGAEISGAALGDLVLKGQVSRIDPQGFTKVSSLGVDQQRVTVIIDFIEGELQRLQDSGRTLGVAYRVQARIFTNQAENALSIPRLALLRASDDGWQVYRAMAGKAALVPVVLGIGNDQRVQVIKGLGAGDLVLVAPPKTLQDGDKISPQTNNLL
jgi:HlyD family secretion protein